MKKILLIIVYTWLSVMGLMAQQGSLKGRILSEAKPAGYVRITLPALQKVTLSDSNGIFIFDQIPVGKHEIQVGGLGYRHYTSQFDMSDSSLELSDIHIVPDVLSLDAITITGNRNEVSQYNSAVKVHRIDSRILDLTQSQNLSEGLRYSPGLRTENNCQNCGFTQVRMNGLPGAYSQILINSRPLMSALSSVYGLEWIPSGMIDRIEVVRGGGSVLFGGNAIAGTINVITKIPDRNTAEAGLYAGIMQGGGSDVSGRVSGALVHESKRRGFSFYGFTRKRQDWDQNQDGFSELPELENQTLGMDAFFYLGKHKKVSFSSWSIREHRRGGDQLHLAPHLSEIAEQLQHSMQGGNITLETGKVTDKHRFTLFFSGQHTLRNSYYGGGGRLLSTSDSLTSADLQSLYAYGRAPDFSLNSGIQHTWKAGSKLLIVSGSEWQYNKVHDQIPGYRRDILQRVGAWGNYIHSEFSATEHLTFTAGIRQDLTRIEGRYRYDGTQVEQSEWYPVTVPRIGLMAQIAKQLKGRVSYAQGYRLPQAFDEDLHLETVGGGARYIQLSPDLKAELSHSLNASLQYSAMIGQVQLNWTIDGFYTRLLNPFIIANPEVTSTSVSYLIKRNGAGAQVGGMNTEFQLAMGNRWVFQAAMTLQAARYDEAETIWEAAEDAEISEERPAFVSTRRLLRTPDVYGYAMLQYQMQKRWTLSGSMVYTGGMEVPHMVDAETAYTMIRTTRDFQDIQLKAEYAWPDKNDARIKCYGGVLNLLNALQPNPDRGPLRDAGYMYGPGRPRTFFAGITFRI